MKIGGRAHTAADAEEIARAGFPFAEISLLDAHAFHGGELEQLQAVAAAYGITYLAHGPEEGDALDPDELRRSYLPQIQRLIDCAAELGAPLFTLHFWIDKRFIPAPVIEKKIVLLRELADYAHGRRVQLCVENLSEQPADLAPAFDAIAALGMTLDIGHGQLLTPCNTAHAFAGRYPERIRHVHAHDNRGGNSPSDDLHLPIGQGTIDFTAILGCLKSCGFDGTITLEVKPDHLRAGSAILQRIWQEITL
ncbi:MAG: sugar phosphate isomerase/epimerase [Deltaproteobacteria bacterium]|nr:sugar phosphate isomerase/epimerase [Deltaproteobacteria bacterium]